VFDKDEFPADNFDNAIHMAEAAGFFSAYSNSSAESSATVFRLVQELLKFT
jgi:hypothetical protein